MASGDGTTTFFVPTSGDEPAAAQPRVSVAELEAGQAMLVTVRGPTAGRTYVLDGPTVSLGRSPDCDIVLDDMTVSRHHAEFVSSHAAHLVKDAGSRNGVLVNREKVTEATLRPGDELQLGRFRMVYFGTQ